MFDDSGTLLSKKRSYLSSSILISDDSNDSSGSYEFTEDCTSSTSGFEDKDSKDSTIGSEGSEYSLESEGIEIKSNGTDKLDEKKIKHKTIPELKKILKGRGLRVSGTKAELIQRITGVASPSGNQADLSVSKPKKKKVDLKDPFLKECFICEDFSDVPFENKLKDARICDDCKNDPKKRKFTMEESNRIFNLPKSVLRSLPSRRGATRIGFYYLFAINTLAKTCVARYGSLKESREE